MYFAIGDWQTVERLVYLQDELQDYLGTLAGRFPRRFTSLVRLSRLQLFKENLINTTWLRTLIDDLSEMITQLDANPSSFEPPDVIRPTGDDEVEMKFGITGLRKWATDLRAIASLAIERDVPLITINLLS